jgi:hypothetical protein
MATNEKVQLTRGQMERLVEHATAQEQAQASAPPAEQKELPPRQVDMSRVREAEFLRTDWVCTAEFGTTIEQVRDEGYFAHIAARLHAYDHIEVRVDDGTWLAQLLVLECGRNWARTHLLSFHNLTSSDVARTMSVPKVRIEWKGPHLQFCVIRKSDNQILQDKLSSEEAARAWVAAREALQTM